MLLSYSFILCLVESSGVEKIWKFTHKFFRTLSGSHETTNERLEHPSASFAVALQ